MRKFSKILAVLLAVCVIFGVVVMSVSGADDTTNQLDASKLGSNITNYYNNPDGVYDKTHTQIAGINEAANQIKLVAEANNSTGNNYLRVWSPELPPDKYVNNSTSLFAHLANGDFVKFGAYAYNVLDFDIGFDAYLVNGELDYNAMSGEQSYLPGMSLGIFDNKAFKGYIYFVKDPNGEFYLSTDTVYDKNDIKLPTEKDVYTHLTYIANSSNNTIYVFVNGNFYFSVTGMVGLQRICLNPYDAAPVNKFSYAIDNFTSNFYATGYSSGDKYGVDDYLADADFTKPLYNCKDMVYNRNYTYSFAVDGQYAAVVNTAEGESLKYLFAEDAVAALAAMTADKLNGANVNINKSILDWTPSEGLKSVTFNATMGAEVTISQEAKNNGYTVVVFASEDGSVKYTVKMTEPADVVFIDDNGNVLATKQSPIGAYLKTLDVQVPVIQVRGAKYKVLNKWEMRNGDGVPFTFYGNDTRILSDYMIYASDNYTPGVDSIVVKAIYQEVDLAFAVLTKENNALVITNEINVETYTDIANVTKCVNAAEEEVTLVLYDDAAIASGDSINVKAKATVNVDLNGNTLIQNEGTMFVVNDAATLNIVSSTEGAELAQISDGETSLIAGADDAKSYNINIDGKNLAVYAGTLIDIKGGEFVPKEAGDEVDTSDPALSSATDEVPVVINITGGSYYALMPLSDAMFAIRTTEVELNIADATFINMCDGAIFSADTDKNEYFADAAVTVTGTKLIAYGHNLAAVFNVWTKDCEATVTDSEIVGNVLRSVPAGSISLGADTRIQLGTNAIKYTEVALRDELTIAENCIPVRANLYEEITLSIPADIVGEGDALAYGKKEGYKLEVYYGIVLVDETDAAAGDNIVTVTWLDPYGDVYAVEDWFKGSLAVGYDTTEFGVLTDTKNGWYTIGYASWEDESAKDLKYGDYSLIEDVTFRPVKGLVASVGVKVNMSLLTKFEANLYIPLATPENVQILGLFTHYDAAYGVNDGYSVDEDELEEAYIDGMPYDKHSFFFDNSDIDKTVTRYLVIEVDGEVMVQKITVDLLGYAEAVMEQYGCSSEEAVLAYNLINYANEAYEFKTGVEYEAAAEFLLLLDHDIETCECYLGYDYDLEEVSLDYKEGLGENVYGVSYDLSGEMPAFIVYAKTDAKTGASLISKVKVQFYGINSSVDDMMYEYNLTLVRGKDVVIDGATYATFTFKSMPLYNAAEVMSITVTNAADGSEASGTYSLATYIDHFICYPADDSGLDVAQALYSFAKVANEYKNLAD